MYMENKCLAEILINTLPPTMGWLRQKVSENSEPELTLPQFRILANIDSGLTAKHQGVTQPAMSQMVEALIAKKLIIKKINPDDKRQSLLRLSKKGQAWLHQIITAVKNDVAQQFSGLSKIQQKKITEALILLNTQLGEKSCKNLS